MKIRKVKWKDHPILGDLGLDFVNASTNKPYKTIVFAGENGSGKSTILEDISSFLNVKAFKNFEFIEYEADEKTYKAIASTDKNKHLTFFDIEDSEGEIHKIRYDKNNGKEQLESNLIDPRYYGCVFSRARSDYKTQKITATSTSILDSEKYDTDENDDFTALKQLIVDVENQDNSDYVATNRALGSNPKSWDDYYPTSKIYRFKNSFDAFFDNLEYEKVADSQGEKIILFTKNGNSIPVDQLSTGEKQIVFRGIYLLRNSNLLQGAAIMIDEPELSMHPKWQKKILQYYKRLFSQNGQQKSQIFFATHSDLVLREALSNANENIVITLDAKSGVIQTKKIDSPSVLPSITSAETSYLAFDLASNDYHIELYGWLQDKESKRAIKSCDDFIKSQTSYIHSVHFKSSSFGNTNYETLPTYIRNAIHHPDPGSIFTEDELRTSIELLIQLCN